MTFLSFEKVRVVKCTIMMAFLFPILTLAQDAKRGETSLKLHPNNRIQADTTVFLSTNDYELYVYFPGGNDGPTSDSLLSNFLKRNFTYPDSASKARIEGTVYVSFTIDANGSISNIEIIKGSNPYLDSEAIRVISAMHDSVWDKRVAMKDRTLTRRTIPLRFRLE